MILFLFITIISNALSTRIGQKQSLTANDRFEIQDLLVNLFYLQDQLVIDNKNRNYSDAMAAIDEYVWQDVANDLHDDFVFVVNGFSVDRQAMLNSLAQDMGHYTKYHHIISPFGLLSYDVSYVKDAYGKQHVIEDVEVSYSSQIYRDMVVQHSTGVRQFRREDGGAFKNYGGKVTILMYQSPLQDLGMMYAEMNVPASKSFRAEWELRDLGIIALVFVTGILIGYLWFPCQNGRKVRYKHVVRDEEDESL